MTQAPIQDVLHDPVTRHMRRDFVQMRDDLTVGQALDSILANQPEGRIIYFYVTDSEGRLLGVVPTRRLLLSPRDKLLADIMVKGVIAIPQEATVLEACEFFTLHKLLAFPVVDAERRILGLVDVDLYTKELSDLDRREDNYALFQLIGVHLTEAQQRSALAAFRQRFPWLLANITGGLLAAVIADIYQDVSTLLVVVPFIPVVLALAESVTIQSVSLAIESLQGQRPSWSMLVPKLSRELRTGLLLGMACGGLIGGVAIAWKGEPRAALNLLGGIAGSVACAAVIGLAMPYLLRLLKRDPQVAAGPIALAAADMITLLVYFNLARWLLGGGRG
jgi:magnesium transporter